MSHQRSDLLPTFDRPEGYTTACPVLASALPSGEEIECIRRPSILECAEKRPIGDGLPQFNLTVVAGTGEGSTIRGEGERVHPNGVSFKLRDNLSFLKVPNFYSAPHRLRRREIVHLEKTLTPKRIRRVGASLSPYACGHPRVY